MEKNLPVSGDLVQKNVLVLWIATSSVVFWIRTAFSEESKQFSSVLESGKSGNVSGHPLGSSERETKILGGRL